MRKFLAYVWFIGDSEQRQQFFSEVHHLVILTQAFGLLSWLVAAILLWHSRGDHHLSILWGAPGILFSLLLTMRMRTLPQLIVSGALGALTTAWAYRLFLAHADTPPLWVLPIGMAIALAAAPVFSGLIYYLATASGVWLILGVGNFPGAPGQLDFSLSMVAVAGSLCIGAYLNAHFLTLRVRNFNAARDLTALAFKDSVTGLDNRRKFMLDARTAQLREDDLPRHLLMIDIDDFKHINDTLGHDAGDDVLRQTATVIGRLAHGHVCGRLGGEEFGIVFAGSMAAAEAMACALLREVQTACQPACTVSIGIARLDRRSELAHSYRAADQALYAAKRAGKNRYVVAAPALSSLAAA